MPLKQYKFYSVIISYIFLLNLCNGCPEDPFYLDEHFVGCCRGRPIYTSESCIDELLANDTFSQVCLLDCMYRKFKFYDGAQIDLAAVQNYFSGQIEDESFNLMYTNAFERCSQLDKADIMEKFSFVKFENVQNCDDYAQFVDICVWYHTLANCPEHYASNDDGCIARRNWVNDCLLKS